MRRREFIGFFVLLSVMSNSLGQNISCCRQDQQLDTEKEQCIDNPSTLSTYAEDGEGWSEPLIKCLNGSQWSNFTIQFSLTFDGKVPNKNQHLKEGDYCTHPAEDGTNMWVFYCQRPTIFPKCCPLGMSINRTSISQCVPNADGSDFFNATKYIETDTQSYKIKANSSIQCEYDFNVYLPKLFVDNGFKVNGSRLVVRRAMYDVLRYADYYCVDEAIDAQNNKEVIFCQNETLNNVPVQFLFSLLQSVAVTCLSWRMYLLRYLLFGYNAIYPYLHFVSAFLLLLTVVVYCLLPPLRDNIQGYSMLCFLICMIIVQTEYGVGCLNIIYVQLSSTSVFQNFISTIYQVILLIPLEPHTWCFQKVWISTYFRYASSCWITVMGFNIWTQLK